MMSFSKRGDVMVLTIVCQHHLIVDWAFNKHVVSVHMLHIHSLAVGFYHE